jgi:hypothetical protein
LFDSTLVACNTGKAVLIGLPSYKSLGKEARLHTLFDCPPQMTVWQSPCDDLDLLATDGWKGPALDNMFCSLIWKGEDVSLRSYQLVPIADNPTLPPHIPVESGECQDVVGERQGDVPAINYPNRRIWRTSTHFYLLAENVNEEKMVLQYEIPKKQLSPTLHNPNVVRLTSSLKFYPEIPRDCDMCFSTGRLVIALPPPHGDDDAECEIQIMDYFAPPSFYS